jgi:4-cresol dehydrogenase (hydroxylating)
MHGALWEDDAIADHKLAKIQAAFEQIPGAKLRFSKHAPDEIPELENFSDRVPGGVPNLEWLAHLRWYGTDAGAHTGTGLVTPLDGKEVYKLHKLIREVIEREAGLDYFAGLSAINARSGVLVFGSIFDVTSESDTRRGYEACRRVLLEGGKLGFGEYRAHLDNMDLAADQYSFNNPALPAVLRDHQRRCGPQRDPGAEEAGHLAGVLQGSRTERSRAGSSHDGPSRGLVCRTYPSRHCKATRMRSSGRPRR